MTRSLDRPAHGAHETAADQAAGVPPRTPAPTAAEAGGAVLEAGGIEKAYRRGIWSTRRSTPVLRGADLTLSSGEVVGLVGENGSGKSTLMKILVGALPADAGTVTVAGGWATARRSRSSTSD
jgi:ABC-2 type transport system ATP-binding protein